MVFFLRRGSWRSVVARVALALLTLSFATAPTEVAAQRIFERLGERLRSRLEPAASPESPLTDPIGQDGRARRAARYLRGLPQQPQLSSRNRSDETGEEADAAPDATLGIEAVERRGSVPGLEVARIYPHSRADDAGLQRGDLIVMVGGKPTPNVGAIAEQLKQREVGDVIQIRVLRPGGARNLQVQLVGPPSAAAGETLATPLGQPWATPLGRPRVADSDGEAQPQQSNRPPSSGLTQPPPVQPNARPAAAQLGLPSPPTPTKPNRAAWLGIETTNDPAYGGAVVENIAANSPARQAGLLSGDRIVSINGLLVEDAESLSQEIEQKSPGSQINLHVARDGKLIQTQVTLSGPEGTAASAPVGSQQGTQPGGGSDVSQPTQSGKDAESVLKGFGSIVGGLFQGNASSGAAPAVKADSASKNEAPANPKANSESGSTDETPKPPEDLPPPLPQPAEEVEPTESDSNPDSTAGPDERAQSRKPAIQNVRGETAMQSDSGSDSVGLKQAPPTALLATDPPSLKDLEQLDRLPVAAAALETGLSSDVSGTQQAELQQLVDSLQVKVERLESRLRQLEREGTDRPSDSRLKAE